MTAKVYADDIDRDDGRAIAGPLPAGFEVVGVVERRFGGVVYCSGAAVLLPTGAVVEVSAGLMHDLPAECDCSEIGLTLRSATR
ncbi:MAG: hypothetical protein WC642_08450 [Nocardioides sp.]|jgi:hypothetical protein